MTPPPDFLFCFHSENEEGYSKMNARFEFYALELTLYVSLKQIEFSTPPPDFFVLGKSGGGSVEGSQIVVKLRYKVNSRA